MQPTVGKPSSRHTISADGNSHRLRIAPERLHDNLQRAGAAGVDEAVQGLHQDRTGHVGAIGVQLVQLARVQLAEYNQACRPGDYRPLQLDGVATEGLTPPKSNWALPIDKGPLYAYPIISANVFTFGGLKTDQLGRVVDQDGDAIKNLYAAGEMTGLYYGTYTGSTSVLRGMVFGRLAGLHAARTTTAMPAEQA